MILDLRYALQLVAQKVPSENFDELEKALETASPSAQQQFKVLVQSLLRERVAEPSFLNQVRRRRY